MSSRSARLAVLALIGASFLYGATFVIIKSALDDIGPLSFVSWRFLIGAAVLCLIAFPRGRAIWRDGSVAGLALFAGYVLQTAGLEVTTASNSALITGLYVVFTPILAAVFQRHRPAPLVVGAAVLAFIGIFLLTETSGFSLRLGDLLTLGCALAFALHIIALARYAGSHPVVPFTAVQVTLVAVLAFPLALGFEGVGLPAQSVWPALAATGLGVGVGAFLLQVWSQTILAPGTVGVILAAEPAFAVATAWVVLGERLDTAGWIGAMLIAIAIVIVIQLATTTRPE